MARRGVRYDSVDLDADAISPYRWNHETQLLCPDECLCHVTPDTSIEERIAEQIQVFSEPTDYNSTHAVYTLECRARSRGSESMIARTFCYSSNPHYVNRATSADVERLFYVGRAKDLPQRLAQHAVGDSAAANFTTVFPPVRLVDLDWFPTFWQCAYAESEKENMIREALPNAYVYQL